jgi:alpha-glucuronidase
MQKTRPDENGYELWMRYLLIEQQEVLTTYQNAIQAIVINLSSRSLNAAKEELERGLAGLLGKIIPLNPQTLPSHYLFCGKLSELNEAEEEKSKLHKEILGDEGFAILSDSGRISILANTDTAILYGVFHFLRHLQTSQSLSNLRIISRPKIKLRMLNHWDNLDGTIERGYAGYSLWDWHKLPHYAEPRYRDYARANASIGINATVLTNVNANALILSSQYLEKVAALADIFRPYGIKIFLTARFSAPIEIGGLETANPLDADVANWWKERARLIYEAVPDFGGFLVKANSEGQPGPHDYECSHADGANMLAAALKPYGGIVIWRAFVYDHQIQEDRFKQANLQLVPQDGQFHENVVLQVKNGPIDFQPREPYHPLFGAMPKTPLFMEFQITQEYLGCATHLVYLAPLFKETLDAETYAKGTGSTVAKIVDGSLDSHSISGIAGVSNIGDEPNWAGHPFGAANWYAFGRLAWDYELSSEQIAEEWLKMSFTNDVFFVQTAKKMMMTSREAVVNYMMPLGLHHIFALGHHYGPGPWVDTGRPDWTAVYYHQASAKGIGFDRSETGSNAVSLYHPPYRNLLSNPDNCPENLLLWFHHLPWDYQTKSGRSLWDELCYRYHQGVHAVREMQGAWASLVTCVDMARFEHVRALLAIQEREAVWWRDACLSYFQSFSGEAIPSEYEQPKATLDFYRSIQHFYVPGIPEKRFG